MGQHEEIWAPIKGSWSEAEWAFYNQGMQALQFEVQRVRLGQLVKTARLAKGLSQRALAELTGVQQREICRIENHKGNPTLATQHKLFSALGIRTVFEIPAAA